MFRLFHFVLFQIVSYKDSSFVIISSFKVRRRREGVRGVRPYRKKVTLRRAHRRGNGWLGGAWRREDPRKGRSCPCKGRADEKQPQGRVARGMSARGRVALRRAGPWNCGLGKGEPRKGGLTKGRLGEARAWESGPKGRPGEGQV